MFNEIKEDSSLDNQTNKHINLELKKLFDEKKITFSSSSLNLLSCFVDLLSYNSIVDGFEDEIFGYIFFLFEYYIYGSMNMLGSKEQIKGLFKGKIQTGNNNVTDLGKASKEVHSLKRTLFLKKFFFSLKKKISEKAFNDSNDPLIPTLSNEIYVDDNNLYSCLIEKIVCYESCLAIFKFIKRLFTEEKIGYYLTKFREYKNIFNELKIFFYYPICQNIYNLSDPLFALKTHDWDLSESDVSSKSSEANSYINDIADEIFEKYNNITLLSSDGLSEISKMRFFSVVITYLIDELAYAISEIQKFSLNGISFLLKDIKFLKVGMSKIVENYEDKIKCKSKFDNLLMYITSFSYEENELLNYMKEKRMQIKLIMGVIKVGIHFANLKTEKKIQVTKKVLEIGLNEIIKINSTIQSIIK